jgi:hypothetical protein
MAKNIDKFDKLYKKRLWGDKEYGLFTVQPKLSLLEMRDHFLEDILPLAKADLAKEGISL